MKQEIAKKYLKEIEYFANGGELLCKADKDSEWCSVKKPSFENPDAIYIKNDEYMEFRKAIYEDKRVQMYCKYEGQEPFWDDMTEPIKSIGFTSDVIDYRIKPEFKVNDFVVSPNQDIEQIYSLREINGKLSAQFSEVQEDGTDDISEWKLWQAEIGKYHLFRNPDTNYVLAKLIDIKDGVYKIQSNPFNKFNGYDRYKECHPFMGRLPKDLN